jgi:hypothetical protein
MTRKIWISSVLLLTGATLVLAPTTAFAGSPLLSGYGGPGAGEQAVIGSTLIGGSGGGGATGGSSGSGGSGGANLSGSAGVSTSSTGGASPTGSGSAGGSGVGAANAGTGSHGTTAKGGATLRAPQRGRSTGAAGGSASAYVYATSQGSVASASALTGISGSDVLLLVGILATLGLVAVLTLRLSRLQS